MPACACTRPPVITMSPDATVLAVADELNGDQVGIVVLGSPGEVQSVISERDIVRGWPKPATLP